MRGGRLRRSITIQARTGTIDSTNPSWRDGNPQTWTDVATNVRAGVEPVSGREQLAGQQIKGETAYRVVFRYQSYPTLTVRNRIQFSVDGTIRTLDIASAMHKNTGRREWELLCTEGMTDG